MADLVGIIKMMSQEFIKIHQRHGEDRLAEGIAIELCRDLIRWIFPYMKGKKYGKAKKSAMEDFRKRFEENYAPKVQKEFESSDSLEKYIRTNIIIPARSCYYLLPGIHPDYSNRYNQNLKELFLIYGRCLGRLLGLLECLFSNETLELDQHMEDIFFNSIANAWIYLATETQDGRKKRVALVNRTSRIEFKHTALITHFVRYLLWKHLPKSKRHLVLADKCGDLFLYGWRQYNLPLSMHD